MRKRATAKQVAEAAGVSKWTVIRAFTPGASITEESKRKVLEIAAALNYTPNLLARSLATNTTGQVAVFVDDFSNPQKLPFLEALTEKLQAAGLVVMLININNHFDHVNALLHADQRQVDAIVLFGTAFRDETLIDLQHGNGIPPMFVLARDSQIEGVPAVVCDAELALREIVDHLHAKGYKRPGFMSGAAALSTALRRRHHFTEFWAQKGITEIALLSAEKYSAEAGAVSVRRYLSETAAQDRVDVLMCENDILAIGALDEIRGKFGLRVPEEIAVVGFDNYELSGSFAYGLTTYEQPRNEMVDVILKMIKGTIELETVTLPGTLIVRKSA
ncbi:MULTISPECIES: LacI family DNA-binding transcriptional regulator [Agrobacterium]|jgi:DNA-binding LacI/PurR family transcriptional regulator|uniref:LacI family transcriptional regulator n=1 Tax=Agrobacterium tumefaciens TaxID=358 RepID=A0AAW8M030_AGRTU|nr:MULTISPECIES: LacI family DNA-binding transcriptional regulator [Agrobacterium]MCP2138021.1 LacI family transcriptional regulator [Rhizobium sp. SLBN-94]EPR23397.1 LacI family transcriptional regulator [Agrobacterium radiobacter DSM 30147]KAB0459125.1 LacI family DNA-binding transcriptional regulator [Agrobacterium tumefaciens]KWT75320.1 LacI family transcriptional regulator [Agrobacterium radiobacter]MBB4409400.1 LacI family transcriptional regulator [Agrobacterium radiobacter]